MAGFSPPIAQAIAKVGTKQDQMFAKNLRALKMGAVSRRLSKAAKGKK